MKIAKTVIFLEQNEEEKPNEMDLIEKEMVHRSPTPPSDDDTFKGTTSYYTETEMNSTFGDKTPTSEM